MASLPKQLNLRICCSIHSVCFAKNPSITFNLHFQSWFWMQVLHFIAYVKRIQNYLPNDFSLSISNMRWMIVDINKTVVRIIWKKCRAKMYHIFRWCYQHIIINFIFIITVFIAAIQQTFITEYLENHKIKLRK